MYSLKSYNDGECTSALYYGQYVNKEIKESLISYFTTDRLVKCYYIDGFMFSILPEEWSKLENTISFTMISSIISVCNKTGDRLDRLLIRNIIKQAARIVVFDINYQERKNILNN